MLAETVNSLFNLIPTIEELKGILFNDFVKSKVIPILVPIITIFGIIFRFVSAQRLESKFDNSAVNLVSEFYFIEDVTSNWDKIPTKLRQLALYNLGKILSRRKFISLDDEKVISYLFDNFDRNIELIKMYFQTDKLIFKENKGLFYRGKYFWVSDNKPNKFSQYFYAGLYFILAIIALIPNFISIYTSVEPFKIVVAIIFWGTLFLFLSFLSLARFKKFYWANKLLEEIYKSK
ncbi:hypothetical protein [Mannheimia pernigra]|uniref:Uncharacterized protein n=1 Tax=Mannheimia pernigra TaxID=111844 RepID=A0A7D5DVP5_9PAST|nr:hypothetical protein [Mannheimia pernigra]QLB40120.1 hypothetical protein HV559_04100 [Mannheimia pernigra]